MYIVVKKKILLGFVNYRMSHVYIVHRSLKENIMFCEELQVHLI